MNRRAIRFFGTRSRRAQVEYWQRHSWMDISMKGTAVLDGLTIHSTSSDFQEDSTFRGWMWHQELQHGAVPTVSESSAPVVPAG